MKENLIRRLSKAMAPEMYRGVRAIVFAIVKIITITYIYQLLNICSLIN